MLDFRAIRRWLAISNDPGIRRIYVTSLAVFVGCAIIAAFSGFYWAAQKARSVIFAEFERESADIRRLVSVVLRDHIAMGELSALPRLPPELLRRLADDPTDQFARRRLADAAQVPTHFGASAIAYENQSGTLASVGTFSDPSAFGVQLKLGEDARLSWNGGFLLRTRTTISDQAGVVGAIVIEQPLKDLTDLVAGESVEGSSKTVPICGFAGGDLLCFPTRQRAELRRPETPFDRQACSGAGETTIGRDFRAVEVLTAMGPIDDTGLCLSLKIDRADLDAPLARALWTGLPLGALILSLGAWIMRRSLMPAARALEESRAQLEFRATHDALTGLPNRVLYFDRLEAAMARARRSRKLMALVYIDIDHFKSINDALGHSAGDDFLRWVAGVLRAATRATDSVCRLSGDEFTIIFEELSRMDDVVARINSLHRGLQFVSEGGGKVDAGFSAGIAFFDGVSAIDSARLIHQADMALYLAKERGRNTHVVYAPDLEQPAPRAEVLPPDSIPEFRTEGCRRLFEAWSAARDGIAPASRNRIDLRGMTNLRGNVGFLDYVGPGTILIRDPGAALPAMMGLDLAGRNILDLAKPSIRRLRAWRYMQVIDQPCGMRFSYEDTEGLVLPLAGQPSMAISGWFSIGESAAHARIEGTADELQFFDIGFGVPKSSDGPAEA